MGNFEQQVKEVLRRGPQIDIANLKVVTDADGDGIFDAINTALSNIGTDATVLVDPLEDQNYNKANNRAPTTQLQTTAEGQIIDFLGVDVELADGVDKTPVDLRHDGAQLRNFVMDANQGNNDISEAIKINGDTRDVFLVDVDVSNAPTGILADGVTNSLISRLTNRLQSPDVDTMIEINSCENFSITNSNVTGFNDDGIQVVNCQDITVKNTFITTDPDGQDVALTGLRNRGTVESSFEVFVETDADLEKGVLIEGFDVGGDDESIPDSNRYEIKIEGARDVGIDLANADTEVVEGSVLGQYGGGKTTTAFEVGGAAGHNISLNVKNTVRVTDSQVSSTQAGISLNGHYSQIDETSTVQFAGSSIVNVTRGPGAPQPLAKVLADTDVNTSVRPQRTDTGGNGTVSIDWSDRYVFEDKPVLNVELEEQGVWYISSFQTDSDGFYTGATIQVDNLDGSAKGSGVSTALTLIGS